MDGAWQLIRGVVFILMIALFVAAEYSFVSCRRSRVEALAKRGNKAAKKVERALKNLSLYIAAFDIGITVFNLLVGRFFEPYITHGLSDLMGTAISPTFSFAIALTLVTFLTVVIGEVVPKYLGIHSPEKVAMWTVWPMDVFRTVCYPLIWLVQFTGKGVLRIFGIRAIDHDSDAVPKEELLLLVKSGGAEGLLDKKHADLVSRALRLDQLKAQDVMIHRLDIRWVDLETPNEDLFTRLGELPHTRVPVCRGDIDDVVGILYIHDVIKHWNDGDFTIEKVLSEAVAVPENLSLDKIIARMREAKTQMLIVMDEYGGTSGLITLEDVVEEVFGELEDKIEHDRPSIDILPSGRISCKASVRFDELLARLAMDLHDEPLTDTLATMIVDKLGHIPKPGDHIDTPIGMLIVENMARRRITRVGVHLSRELQDRLQSHGEQ
jgi:putative hemolysin